MERTERFMLIDRLLRSRRATPLALLMEELEVSRATVKRDIEYMRDRMGAPIVWDRALRGYRYDLAEGDIEAFVLPGLWFNASEVHALLTMDHLLSNLQPGLLGPHIEPLRQRIHHLLEQGDHSAEEIACRIHISRMAERPVDTGVFEAITSGLLDRRRLLLRHHHRGRDETTCREVSPQRLLHYRDNWYLDAWCHLRKKLRSFAVDAMESVEILDRRAREVPLEQLDKVCRSGYGIFAGKHTSKAVLRFSPRISRWVSKERWHSAQEGRFDDRGRYILSVPYARDTELVMDILRYGPEVEVLEPAELRARVKSELEEALDHYLGEE